MAVIESLFRYPVKSMQGEAVDHLTFAGNHADGDRQWAAVDVGTGVTLSAKRHGALLDCAARSLDGGSVAVEVPDAGTFLAGSPELDQAISELLGRDAALRAPGDALPIELLMDPLDEDGEWHAFPVPTGHFADMADAHFLSRSSLSAAADLEPGADWDVRRFRPTVLMGEAGDGFAEDSWVGSVLEVGSDAVFDVFMPTVRCSLPPRAQPGLPRDTSMVKALRDHHDMALGVYAACRREGTIRVGDRISVVPAS